MYTSYLGPREAWGLGMNQFLFLLFKVVRKTTKHMRQFNPLRHYLFYCFALFHLLLVVYAFWNWIIALSYFFSLWPLFITWFLSYILYLVSFSYTDFPLKSESDFCVLDDLRLILSFDNLFLSNHNIQLEKEKMDV